MNTTISQTNESFNYEISTFLLIGMFVISEFLPFIKKTKASGWVHSVVCLMKGSECLAKNIREKAEDIENQLEKT